MHGTARRLQVRRRSIVAVELADISPAHFLSGAFGTHAAVADGGRALIPCAAGVNPSVHGP
jgi:hypothetical protein